MTLFFCSTLTVLWCRHHSLLSACSLRLLALLLLWNHFLVEWMFSQVWNWVHNPRIPYQLICTFILFLANLVSKAIFSKLMKPILYWLGSDSWRQCHITGGDLVSELWAGGSRSSLHPRDHAYSTTSLDAAKLELSELHLEKHKVDLCSGVWNLRLHQHFSLLHYFFSTKNHFKLRL